MSFTQQLRYNLSQSAIALNNAITFGAGARTIARLQLQLSNAQAVFSEYYARKA